MSGQCIGETDGFGVIDNDCFKKVNFVRITENGKYTCFKAVYILFLK